MNTNLELTNAQTVNTVKAGKKYNFDQYDLVENKGSNMQDIYIVVSHLKNDNPFTGEIIKNGMWKDLNFLETKKYLDYLIKNNLLLRELPDINNALFEYYNEQNNFNFYYYDGTKEPKKILDLRTLEYEFESLYGTKNATKAFQKEFVDIMSENLRAAEYQRKQPFIEGEFELWINPTIEQLQEYNEVQNLDPSDNLENFIGYEHIIHNETLNVLQKELEEKGYLILNKSEIIETLKDDFKDFSEDDMSFEEWIEPVKLDELQGTGEYVIDGDLSFQPIKIETLIDERYGQGLNIDEKNLGDYFGNIIITKKGIEQTVRIDSYKLSFYSFLDIVDYLSVEVLDSFDTAHSKITNQNVEVDKPFVEICIMNNEYYVNTDAFVTEKDILDYVNNLFEIEGVDFEAKFFDRATMMRDKMYSADRSDDYKER